MPRRADKGSKPATGLCTVACRSTCALRPFPGTARTQEMKKRPGLVMKTDDPGRTRSAVKMRLRAED